MVAGFAQLKVVSSGNTVVGGTDPGQGNFKTRGTSELELALDAVTGNADFTMQLNNQTKAQFKYNVALQGIEILADQANVGDFGLINGFTMFMSGNNQRVGIGINTPNTKLHVNGVITHGGLAVGSDRRLKTEIEDYNIGLDQLMKIQPKTYKYNGKAGMTDTDRLQIGVIAQDIQEIAPEFVGSFEYQDVSYSENGEETVLGNKEQYLSVNTEVIRYMLVNAVKEQQKQIEEKDARITDLETRLFELENKVNEIVNQFDVKLGGGELYDAGIGQNIPNPFIGETQIAYNIPEKATSAIMNIYDLNGRLLKSIPISHTGKGRMNVKAEDMPAGTYSYQLVVDNQIIGAKKMVKSN